MVKNRIGGSKHKKQKNIVENRNIEYALPGQDYALVLSTCGNMRFKLLCNDGVERLGILRGKHKKRMWVNINDIVLYENWEFQNEKCSILLKYNDNHKEKLISNKEINVHILNKVQDKNIYNYDNTVECPFIFDNSIPDNESDTGSDSDSDSSTSSDTKINTEISTINIDDI